MHQVWKVIVASTLWTIWLARNEAVLKRKKLNKSSLLMLINLRSFKWLEVEELVCHNVLSTWLLAPEGCVQISTSYFRKLF